MNDDELERELDAWLDDHGEQITEPPSDMVVEALDEKRASALLAKRARLVDERDRVAARAAERIAPIESWRDDRTVGIDRQVEWIDRSLEWFARETLPALGRKSLPFPTGTLKLTSAGAGSIEVVNLGEFVAWATDEKHPERDELLHRTVDVAKSALKAVTTPSDLDGPVDGDGMNHYRLVDGNGEVVPGVRLVKPAADRFGVTAR